MRTALASRPPTRWWHDRRPTDRSVIARQLAGLALVAGLGGCAPWLGAALDGQVVDRLTTAPVPGVTVERMAVAHCGLLHGESRWMSVGETRSDPAGRFALSSGIRPAPCLGPPGGWRELYGFLVPGYGERWVTQGEWQAIRGRVTLDPIRTDAARLWATRPRPADEHRGPLWLATRVWARDAALAQAPGAFGQAASPPGVFAEVPGAAFDQVLWLLHGPGGRPVVLARDRARGRIAAWDPDGRPWPVPLTGDGWSLAGLHPRFSLPLLARDGALYLPRVFDTRDGLRGLDGDGWERVAWPGLVAHQAVLVGPQLLVVDEARTTAAVVGLEERAGGPSVTHLHWTPGPPRPLAAVLGIPDPATCLGAFHDYEAAVATTEAAGPVTVVRLRQGHGIDTPADPSDVQPAGLAGPVSACGGRFADHVYVAGAHGQVLHRWGPGSNHRVLPLGALTGGRAWTSFAVTDRQGLYAVNGDARIYFFRSDGQPDRWLGGLGVPRSTTEGRSEPGW